jgi:hypothetical protein
MPRKMEHPLRDYVNNRKTSLAGVFAHGTAPQPPSAPMLDPYVMVLELPHGVPSHRCSGRALCGCATDAVAEWRARSACVEVKAVPPAPPHLDSTTNVAASIEIPRLISSLNPAAAAKLRSKCGRRDLNPRAFRHQYLNPGTRKWPCRQATCAPCSRVARPHRWGILGTGSEGRRSAHTAQASRMVNETGGL